MSVTAQSFWDTEFSKDASALEIHEGVEKVVADALGFFGSIKGKRVLDLGCGNGGTSFILARHGAEVTAVDYSSSAIKALKEIAATKKINNIEAFEYDAMNIDQLGQFDFVFGSLILHHLEPFSQFCDVLRLTLKEGGAAFFYENNAASKLLIWFRRNIVGKLWIPRLGDEDEFPLMPQEVDLLRRHFQVDVRIPEMVFLQLISVYLLKRKLTGLTTKADALLFKMGLGQRYSYRQYVMLRG